MWGGLGGDGGAVCGRHGSDDRQTQAVAVVVVYAPRVEALERLEQAIDLRRRYDPPGVRHGEPTVRGGVAGTMAGALATVFYAVSQHWSLEIPAGPLYGGVSAALVIGAAAGLYPSMRAARLSPTQALRTA